ncbi:CDP-alcohol phosphatidyltransferase family protein [Azomonas macrocytogenes]|uniref:Phosphatidylglycerophosphate synthase n=1 Tax=Azomonas macrocytogenes TaxID=69962 RepID=A0A839T4R2_AZOMA|nr:CDP-alcohol phosphatidyltransferase family protein [Azomonas macrocytogenes]MBB3104432.1 phosphatidylglycerophosphate synthase [Azomonas macrocytogenes]
MTIQIYLVGNCTIPLWGITSRERLKRTLKKYPEAQLAAADAHLPTAGKILLLREDYLYDDRVLNGLLKTADVALQDPRDGTVIAAHVSTELLGGMAQLESQAIENLRLVQPDTIASGLITQLRKFDQPWVARVSQTNRQHLEKSLFNGAYKGVTDFITRGVWPVPARWVTHKCVKLGLSPNHVTTASYVLAILASWLFWEGNYGLGLIAGWIMTFLDTVDGKLARVTVTSTRFGNIFDHALDIVHPPIWYLAWGMGLAATWPFDISLTAVIWVIFIGYLAGRLCEGAFKFAAPFSMFLWQPFDSLNRLITARRNPNLLLLTLACFASREDIGLVLVAAWTVISTLVLAVRLGWALVLKQRGTQLQSWLSQIDPQADGHRPVVRLFAPRSGLADA